MENEWKLGLYRVIYRGYTQVGHEAYCTMLLGRLMHHNVNVRTGKLCQGSESGTCPWKSFEDAKAQPG